MDTHTRISDFTLSLFHPYSMYRRQCISGVAAHPIFNSIFFGHGMGACIERVHGEQVKEEKKCTLDGDFDSLSCLGRFSNTLLGDGVFPTSPRTVKTSPGIHAPAHLNPFLNRLDTSLRYRIRPVPVVFRRLAFNPHSYERSLAEG